MTNVGFGASTSVSWTTDSSTTLIYANISVPSRRTAYNGKGPQLVTDVAIYAAGYSGTISCKLYADGKKTNSISLARDTTPGSSGLEPLTSNLYIADGTTVSFGVSAPSGGVYFYRSSSGTTYGSPAGYTWAGTIRGTYSYVEAPTAPQNLTATPSTTTSGVVNLSWSAPSSSGGSSVYGYEVYLSTGGSYSYKGFTSSTSYVASGLTANTSYSFQVRACNDVTDAAGTTSVSSNTATATAPYIAPPSNVPGAPTALSATTSTTTLGAVNLSWTAPSSNGGSSITDYRIYVDGVYYGAKGGTGTTYTVTDQAQLSTHSFTVSAVNANGESPQSSSVSQSASGVPTKPLNLIATADSFTSNKINLSWSAPSSTGGSVTGYLVYSGSAGVAISATEQSSTTVTVTTSSAHTLQSGNTVHITGTTNGSGVFNGSWTVLGVADSTHFTFTRTSATIASALETGATAELLIADRPVSTYPTTTYSITGLTTGTEYFYYVKAYNAIGIAQTPDVYGPQSDPSSAVAVSVTDAPVVASSEIIPTRLYLSWNAFPSATSYLVTNTTTGETKTVSSAVTTIAWDGLATDTAYGFTKKPNNGATSDPGYGTTNAVSLQSISGSRTITNTTNTGLSTTSAIITSATPTQFTYSKTVADLPETSILSVSSATAVNKLNEKLTDSDGTITTSISAVPSAFTFSYVVSTAPDLAPTNVNGGTTVTNKTNQQLNSDSVTVTSADIPNKTFSYAKSTDSSIISGNISTVAASGTATNLSQASFNVTNAPITEVTEYTISYSKTASDQVTSAATGTIVNTTNRDVYNASVGTDTVVTAPDYKTVTYVTPGGASNVSEATVAYPIDSAERLSSSSDTKLDIVYRSGWIG